MRAISVCQPWASLVPTYEITRAAVVAATRFGGWRPGRDYSVQPGRGKHGVARFVVNEVRREPLGEITEEDARAEGFTDVDKFNARWRELYKHLNPDQEVWVIRSSSKPLTTLPRCQRRPPLTQQTRSSTPP